MWLNPLEKSELQTHELLPPAYPPLPITREPGGNSWVTSDRVAPAVASDYRNTQARRTTDGHIPL